jgi:hypothetical protein
MEGVFWSGVKACAVAVAFVQAVSVEPAGSYRMPVAHPAPPSGSWSFRAASNRPIGVSGEPVRIVRSLVPAGIRFRAYAFDDAGAAAAGVPVTFQLAGGIGCTATTDNAGTATCATEAVAAILLPTVSTYRIVAGLSNSFLSVTGVGSITWG